MASALRGRPVWRPSLQLLRKFSSTASTIAPQKTAKVGAPLPARSVVSPLPPPGRKKVLCIAGPTGVGKTTFSVEAAKRLNGEIVSADSVAVYTHFDIGSDKPPAKAREQVRHHCIDVFDPKSPANAVRADDWCGLALKAIEDIHQRGKLPIVVGGSGMYFQALMYGFGSVPEVKIDLARRASFEEYVRENFPECIEKLKQLDPTYYRLAIEGTDNVRRVASALLKIEALGKPLSELEYIGRKHESVHLNPHYDYRCLFVTMPRIKLYRLVDYRAEKIIERGLLEEVHSLVTQGLFHPGMPAGRSVGYRQAYFYLTNTQVFTRENFNSFLYDYQAVTRGLVKKQETWFRANPDFLWMLRPENESSMVDYIVRLHDLKLEEYLALDDPSPRDGAVSDGLMKSYRSSPILFGSKAAVAPILHRLEGLNLYRHPTALAFARSRFGDPSDEAADPSKGELKPEAPNDKPNAVTTAGVN